VFIDGIAFEQSPACPEVEPLKMLFHPRTPEEANRLEVLLSSNGQTAMTGERIAHQLHVIAESRRPVFPPNRDQFGQRLPPPPIDPNQMSPSGPYPSPGIVAPEMVLNSSLQSRDSFVWLKTLGRWILEWLLLQLNTPKALEKPNVYDFENNPPKVNAWRDDELFFTENPSKTPDFSTK